MRPWFFHIFPWQQTEDFHDGGFAMFTFRMFVTLQSYRILGGAKGHCNQKRSFFSSYVTRSSELFFGEHALLTRSLGRPSGALHLACCCKQNLCFLRDTFDLVTMILGTLKVLRITFWHCGRTQPHNAVCRGGEKCAQQLLQNGAAVDAKDGSGPNLWTVKSCEEFPDRSIFTQFELQRFPHLTSKSS